LIAKNMDRIRNRLYDRRTKANLIKVLIGEIK